MPLQAKNHAKKIASHGEAIWTDQYFAHYVPAGFYLFTGKGVNSG